MNESPTETIFERLGEVPSGIYSLLILCLLVLLIQFIKNRNNLPKIKPLFGLSNIVGVFTLLYGAFDTVISIVYSRQYFRPSDVPARKVVREVMLDSGLTAITALCIAAFALFLSSFIWLKIKKLKKCEQSHAGDGVPPPPDA